MKISHEITFHGVGQGLFVSGKVSSEGRCLDYVYDCGGETSSRILKGAIGETASNMDGSGLDILFLSHLHLDHVSGLPFLLKKLKAIGGVKNVVLPYMYPAERAALAGFADETGGYPPDPSGWYLKFLKAPAAYLVEHGVEKVYFVHGGDGPDTPPLEEIMPRPPDDESNRNNQGRGDGVRWDVKFIGKSKVAENEKDAYAAEESAVGGDALSGIEWLDSSSSSIGVPDWFFLLYNKKAPDHKLVRLREDFHDILAGRSIEDVLMDRMARSEVRIAYEHMFGATKLNDTSLAVLSAGRVQQGYGSGMDILSERVSMSKRARKLHSIYVEEIEETRPPCGSLLGTVLLGDLPAKEEWGHLSRKFGLAAVGRRTLVSTYQVPHHGSVKNWCEHQAQLAGRPTYVISAGIHNRHGHPCPEVLRDIALSGNPAVWVNENMTFRHTQEIN